MLSCNFEVSNVSKKGLKGVFTFCFIWSRYHVPRSWFHPSANTFVVFEEKGGDPTKITFSRRVVTSVCSIVSEHYPTIDLESWDKSTVNDGLTAVKVQLSCSKGKKAKYNYQLSLAASWRTSHLHIWVFLWAPQSLWWSIVLL
jgi:hypothetical protein